MKRSRHAAKGASADVADRLLADLETLRAPGGYLRAGGPRYATLFGRDSLIAAWQTLRIDPSIAEGTLRTLARYQGRRVRLRSEEEPGKILHEYRFGKVAQAELPEWRFPYYGSVDSTPLFLVVAGAYVDATEDASIVDALWDAFASAYRWMTTYADADGDGLLEYERKNPHGLVHQGWKDGQTDHLRIRPPVAIVEVQGYAHAAYRVFARFAENRGEVDLAREARRRALSIFDALNRAFWMPDRGFYALGLDATKQPRRAITSNPGHLLLMDAVPRDRIDRVVGRLFREDLWTPYGIRTHASSEPDYDPYGYHTGTVWPHDNWFLYQGLRRVGRPREALRFKHALLRAYRALGRMPELYAVVDGRLRDLTRGDAPTAANPLQAWSSAGLLDMIWRG